VIEDGVEVGFIPSPIKLENLRLLNSQATRNSKLYAKQASNTNLGIYFL